MTKVGSNGGGGVGQELRLLLERVQRLRVEQKELKLDEKDVFNEAKGRGYDPATMKRVLKWLDTDPNKRREAAALDEVYKAALGMGDGSLSDLARDFLSGKRPGADDDDGQLDAFKTPAEGKGGAAVSTDFGDDLSDKPLTVEDAAKLGAEAAKGGRPVTANPFKAGDERRAAWDEAWCGALGSDGMDIPVELRPTPKPPKDDKKGDDK